MRTIFHVIKVHTDRRREAKSELRRITNTNAMINLAAALNQWKMRNLKESMNTLNLKNHFIALSINKAKDNRYF